MFKDYFHNLLAYIPSLLRVEEGELRESVKLRTEGTTTSLTVTTRLFTL